MQVVIRTALTPASVAFEQGSYARKLPARVFGEFTDNSLMYPRELLQRLPVSFVFILYLRLEFFTGRTERHPFLSKEIDV